MNPLHLQIPSRKGLGKRAFSLVEVAMAIGLVSFVLVSLIGLLSIGLDATRESQSEIRAANLASKIISQRRAAPLVDDPSSFYLPTLDLQGVTTIPKELTGEFFVGENGEEVGSADLADFRVIYKIVHERDPARVAYLTLNFHWPAGVAASASDVGDYRVSTAISLP